MLASLLTSLVVLAVDPAAAAAPKVETPFKLTAVESGVLARTNMERARRKLPPLMADPELTKSARRHALWMTKHRTLRHASVAAAENIAMGQSNATQVVRAWMNSSGHRANILNRSHRRIGIGAYVTRGGTIYWCQQFLR